jgi:hypothetical protein
MNSANSELNCAAATYSIPPQLGTFATGGGSYSSSTESAFTINLNSANYGLTNRPLILINQLNFRSGGDAIFTNARFATAGSNLLNYVNSGVTALYFTNINLANTAGAIMGANNISVIFYLYVFN